MLTLPFKQLQASPSRYNGIEFVVESQVHFRACMLIQALGKHLQNSFAILTACSYYHEFFTIESLCKHNFEVVAVASLFLATKVEDSLKYIQDFIRGMNRLRNGSNSQPIDDSGPLYTLMCEAISTAEWKLLTMLDFDFDTPNYLKLMMKYCTKLDYKESTQEAAWQLLLDSFRFPLSLLFDPNTIVCTIILMTASALKLPLRPKDFVEKLCEANLETVRECVNRLRAFYTTASTYPEMNIRSTRSLPQSHTLGKSKHFFFEYFYEERKRIEKENQVAQTPLAPTPQLPLQPPYPPQFNYNPQWEYQNPQQAPYMQPIPLIVPMQPQYPYQLPPPTIGTIPPQMPIHQPQMMTHGPLHPTHLHPPTHHQPPLLQPMSSFSQGPIQPYYPPHPQRDWNPPYNSKAPMKRTAAPAIDMASNRNQPIISNPPQTSSNVISTLQNHTPASSLIDPRDDYSDVESPPESEPETPKRGSLDEAKKTPSKSENTTPTKSVQLNTTELQQSQHQNTQHRTPLLDKPATIVRSGTLSYDREREPSRNDERDFSRGSRDSQNEKNRRIDRRREDEQRREDERRRSDVRRREDDRRREDNRRREDERKGEDGRRRTEDRRHDERRKDSEKRKDDRRWNERQRIEQREEEDRKRRRDDEDRRRRDDEDRRRRDDEDRRKREDEDRRRKEDEDRRRREDDRRKREEEERRKREEEERRKREEEERRKREEEERKRKEEKKKEEDAKRRREEDLKKREEEKKKNDEARKKQEDAIKNKDEGKRRQQEEEKKTEHPQKGSNDPPQSKIKTEPNPQLPSSAPRPQQNTPPPRSRIVVLQQPKPVLPQPKPTAPQPKQQQKNHQQRNQERGGGGQHRNSTPQRYNQQSGGPLQTPKGYRKEGRSHNRRKNSNDRGMFGYDYVMMDGDEWR